MAGKPNLALFNGIGLDRDYSSDGPDDDGYDYGYESEVTLDSIKKSTTIRLSISANYTNWGPREAFRELVQNWYYTSPPLDSFQLLALILIL